MSRAQVLAAACGQHSLGGLARQTRFTGGGNRRKLDGHLPAPEESVGSVGHVARSVGHKVVKLRTPALNGLVGSSGEPFLLRQAAGSRILDFAQKIGFARGDGRQAPEFLANRPPAAPGSPECRVKLRESDPARGLWLPPTLWRAPQPSPKNGVRGPQFEKAPQLYGLRSMGSDGL